MSVNLLTQEDRQRVEIYMRMVDELATVHEALMAWAAAGRKPGVTDEMRAKSAAEVEEHFKPIFEVLEADEFRKKLPTTEMIKGYVLEQILQRVEEIQKDVAEIKEQI